MEDKNFYRSLGVSQSLEKLGIFSNRNSPLLSLNNDKSIAYSQGIKDATRMDFSPSNAETDTVDMIVRSNMPTMKKIVGDWISIIDKRIKKERTLKSARSTIERTMLGELPDLGFSDLQENINIINHLVGRVEVEEEEIRRDAKRRPKWLNLPFIEQINFFRQKISIPTENWKQFRAEQHDFAFTVSGLTRADLLDDARWLVDKAIGNGDDIDTFARQFKRLIGRRGWQISDRRIYTILDTNSRRSYAAGRIVQARRKIKERPFWVWVHRDSVSPRPHHLVLDNKAIPAEHPFWDIATPSCGFGCRCTFFTANARMLNKLGASILANPPNPRTVAEEGFQRAPGISPAKDKRDILEKGISRLSPGLRDQIKKTVKF